MQHDKTDPYWLNKQMEFYCPIKVNVDGSIEQADVLIPDLLDDELDSAGWQFFTKGYSGQQGYNGPIMHNSEFIGGRLADDIVAKPGYYVALVSNYSECPECEGIEDADCQNDHAEGWAIAFKPIPESETGANRAAIALQSYYNTHDDGTYGDEGSDCFVSAMQDLLTDLRHLAFRAGVDFEAANDHASNRYCEELESEGN